MKVVKTDITMEILNRSAENENGAVESSTASNIRRDMATLT
jgi:hypothetical protein